MNQGRRSEEIFRAKRDYRTFIELLKDSVEMWNLRVAAYCLMSTHYHILMQTPDANISRAMRHIDGVYTQRYNRTYSLDGPLFRGRYKSILVDGDSYLLQLVRYIHRNPVKAGIVTKPENYPWSSHRGYLSVSRKWDWLHKGFVLSLFTQDKMKCLRYYRRFVGAEEGDGMANILEAERWPAVLGPEKFVDWVKGKYYAATHSQEIPQVQDLAPSVDVIKDTVCDFYAAGREVLYKSRRGEFNEPRNVAILLTRRLRRENLKSIAHLFQAENYSSIGSAIERMQKRLSVDPNLKARVQRVTQNIARCHEQT
jgi:REP element-mobilizing transposase RayT